MCFRKGYNRKIWITESYLNNNKKVWGDSYTNVLDLKLQEGCLSNK